MSNEDQLRWRLWQSAAKREPIDRALRELYADLDAAVVQRGPVCNASGRCCRFEEFGHRLYVTGLEIAWFLLGVGARGSGSGAEHDAPSDNSTASAKAIRLNQLSPNPNTQTLNPITPNCPYQIDGLCSTHAIRPLGCRVFFCEEGTETWQQDTTELFLNRLKQLHLEHDLPYAYMEWRMGLAEATRILKGPGF